jgi:hypothetical protein
MKGWIARSQTPLPPAPTVGSTSLGPDYRMIGITDKFVMCDRGGELLYL